jgi:hypothetical protein
MKEKLALAGLTVCLLGLIGTVGAIETDTISIRQGMVQIFIFGSLSWAVYARGV